MPPAAVFLVAVAATAAPGTRVDDVLVDAVAVSAAPAVGLADVLLGAVVAAAALVLVFPAAVAVLAVQLSFGLQEDWVVAVQVLPAAAPLVVSLLCLEHHLPLHLLPHVFRRNPVQLFPAMARRRPADLGCLRGSLPASSAVFCHG